MKELQHFLKKVIPNLFSDGIEESNRRKNMSKWKKYRQKGVCDARPYIKGEDLTGVSITPEDDPLNDMGMIVRNPWNHESRKYIAREYFEENLEPI